MVLKVYMVKFVICKKNYQIYTENEKNVKFIEKFGHYILFCPKLFQAKVSIESFLHESDENL